MGFVARNSGEIVFFLFCSCGLSLTESYFIPCFFMSKRFYKEAEPCCGRLFGGIYCIDVCIFLNSKIYR